MMRKKTMSLILLKTRISKMACMKVKFTITVAKHLRSRKNHNHTRRCKNSLMATLIQTAT